METKKIAIACFIGAAIGTGVAVIVIPMFWWLGMLAGFGFGYLCYDLKEIREKAPIVWRTAKKGSIYSLDWLKIPHPFLCLFLVTTSALLYPLVKAFRWTEDANLTDKIAFGFILSLTISFAITTIAVVLIQNEAERKRCFWQGLVELWTDARITAMIEEGYTQICPTYKNIYGLLLSGLKHVVWSAIVNTPKVMRGIGIGLWKFLCFIFCGMWVLLLRFVWYLFKLIHSQKRVLCGFDSAIGVAITYLWLGSKAVTPAQQIMVVICGGLIGAVVGVLNYEIIFKRLLHLTPATNNV